MKAKFALLTFLFSALISFAQTSDKGFSFQGFAIDPDGKALGLTAVTVKFTISASVGTGGNYSETFALTTDAYGVFNSVIGKGTKESGSDDFKTLDFTRAGTTYKLKVEVKKTNGGVYTTINESDFNAVPYARKAENGVPVGTIVFFAGPKTKIPDGWAVCDGTLVDGSLPQWKQLYNVLGSTWGAGSGSNFNLPDLRGMFLRGVNDGRADAYRDPDAGSRTAIKTGGNAGDNVGSVQSEGLKAQSHTGSGNTNTDGSHQHTGHVTARADNDDNDTPHNFLTYNDANYYYNTININSNGSAHSHAFSFTSNNTGGNETRPVNAGVYYIIKY